MRNDVVPEAPPSLDCSCGVAKEAEPSETHGAHVTSPNWSRFHGPPTHSICLSLGLLSRKGAPVSADTSGGLIDCSI